MERSFWIGTPVTNFLVEGYNLTSVWGLIATCLGASSLAILYEGGRIYKLHCKSRVYSATRELTDSTADTATLMTSCSDTTSSRSAVDRLCHAAKYTILCVQNELIGYILMLSIMRYNLAIAIAIWLGAGLGYFIFAANASIPPSSSIRRQNSGGRSERSASPHQDLESVTDKFAENIAGNEDDVIWATAASHLPLNSGNQDVMDGDDDFPGHDENQGNVLTATVIVHREPSS